MGYRSVVEISFSNRLPHRSSRHPGQHPGSREEPLRLSVSTKDPGTKWTAPDMAKAKQLMQQSGTIGQEVTIIVQDVMADRDIGVYLQSVLNDLGFKASV
jgi:ABC-type transport system substrate-binding protein